MTNVQLFSHPGTPLPAVSSLTVALRRGEAGSLSAQFDCRCAPGALRLPQAKPARCADELWRHTCCELFSGVAGDAAYREFNWSPSGEWAMYDFADYRVRAAAARPTPAPRIEFAVDGAGWTLQVHLAGSALPEAAAAAIELGVAAVLEAADGSLSYWAPKHTGERPDFHRRAAFSLHLDGLS